ncbi:hypothetical protein EJ05DRAFT_484948 [Pseudovirgaria hyperparasitica]|uniref:Uncharacterized protein n=1 Tax=Pseudovirgaria hyperparasitica TaxID=470096 RepID=A0A6A6WB65_9PEZI|nr:uncharacterized protein EJ05DRAFT_484948 [Pseudovirgaria hyperparasitica]KAF2758847.1 hypothetical protein EJ05DRAFT_484948 [Pseudovirgaria hyperparasitica]
MATQDAGIPNFDEEGSSILANVTRAKLAGVESSESEPISTQQIVPRLKRESPDCDKVKPEPKCIRHIDFDVTKGKIVKLKVSHESLQKSQPNSLPKTTPKYAPLVPYEEFDQHIYYWSSYQHDHPVIAKFLAVSATEKIKHPPLPGKDVAIRSPAPQIYVHFLPHFFANGAHAVSLQKGLGMFTACSHLITPCSEYYSKWDWEEDMREFDHVYRKEDAHRGHKFIWEQLQQAWEAQIKGRPVKVGYKRHYNLEKKPHWRRKS